MKTLALPLILLSLMAAPAANSNPNPAGQDETKPAATFVVRPDPWVLTKIKAKFAISTMVQAMSIDVDVREGVVYLRGRVSGRTELLEAIKLARETEGVRKVDSTGLKIQ